MKKVGAIALFTVALVTAGAGALPASTHAKTVAGWKQRSFESKMLAGGCGQAFEMSRKLPRTVKHVRLGEPTKGSRVLDPQGDLAARISTVDKRHLSDGSWELSWRAEPGLQCPRPRPLKPAEIPEPAPVTVSPLTETKAVLPTPPTAPPACKIIGESTTELMECMARQQRYNEESSAYAIARGKAELEAHRKYEEEVADQQRAKQAQEAANTRHWQEENAARMTAWRKDVEAQEVEEKSYKDRWGTKARRVRTHLVYFAYEVFVHRKVAAKHQPSTTTCIGICRARKLTSYHLLIAYHATKTAVGCRRLFGAVYRCHARWDTPGPLCGATSKVRLEPYVQVRLSLPNAILGGEDWECDRS